MTSMAITETGAQTVIVTQDGVAGERGLPGRGLTGTQASATTNRTLTPNTYQPVDASGAAVTVTLPANAAAGDQIAVRKMDTSANAVVIGHGACTIDGGTADQSLTVQFRGRTFISDGANGWFTYQASEPSATTTATANRGALRDVNGRTKMADPAAADDVATKGYVDSNAVVGTLLGEGDGSTSHGLGTQNGQQIVMADTKVTLTFAKQTRVLVKAATQIQTTSSNQLDVTIAPAWLLGSALPASGTDTAVGTSPSSSIASGTPGIGSAVTGHDGYADSEGTVLITGASYPITVTFFMRSNRRAGGGGNSSADTVVNGYCAVYHAGWS
jgi:hypothetical protein